MVQESLTRELACTKAKKGKVRNVVHMYVLRAALTQKKKQRQTQTHHQAFDRRLFQDPSQEGGARSGPASQWGAARTRRDETEMPAMAPRGGGGRSDGTNPPIVKGRGAVLEGCPTTLADACRLSRIAPEQSPTDSTCVAVGWNTDPCGVTAWTQG